MHLAPSYREFPTTRGLLPRRCDLAEIRIGDVIPKLSSRMQRQCPRDNWPRGQFWYRCITCTLVRTTSSVQIGSSSAVRRVSALVQRVSRYRAGEGGSGRAGAACSRGSPTSRAMSGPEGRLRSGLATHPSTPAYQVRQPRARISLRAMPSPVKAVREMPPLGADQRQRRRGRLENCKGTGYIPSGEVIELHPPGLQKAI